MKAILLLVVFVVAAFAIPSDGSYYYHFIDRMFLIKYYRGFEDTVWRISGQIQEGLPC